MKSELLLNAFSNANILILNFVLSFQPKYLTTHIYHIRILLANPLVVLIFTPCAHYSPTLYRRLIARRDEGRKILVLLTVSYFFGFALQIRPLGLS